MICQLLQIWKVIFHCCSPNDPAAAYEGKELVRIKQILSYLDQNYMNQITLEDISKVINLCPGECSRFFRRATGMTLFSYLLQHRIRQSRRLLSETGLGIAQIALECGFSSQSYFTACFRRQEGCTPQQYRQRVFRPVTALSSTGI